MNTKDHDGPPFRGGDTIPFSERQAALASWQALARRKEIVSNLNVRYVMEGVEEAIEL